MIALLRYLLTKSYRDHVLVGMTISPTVMLVAPTLGTGAVQAIRGHAWYPLTIDPRMSALATATLFGHIVAMMAAIFGAIAAFWIIREEISNRSVGFFLLARRPWAVTVAATVYGTATAIAGSLICFAAIALLTANFPPNVLRLIALSAAVALISAAQATAFVAISPEIPMLVPVYALSLGVAAAFLEYGTAIPVAAALLLFAVTAVAAPTILRRRCAA